LVSSVSGQFVASRYLRLSGSSGSVVNFGLLLQSSTSNPSGKVGSFLVIIIAIKLF
jgi:hypothetical protein